MPITPKTGSLFHAESHLVPGVLCSLRLFAAQTTALADTADIVVPDWRRAPLSIWYS